MTWVNPALPGYEWVQQGWQCPVCKRVYSPSTVMCFYCGNTTTKENSNTEPLYPVPDKDK